MGAHRWGAIHDVIHGMKNHQQIEDWSAIARDVDSLEKQLSKAAALVRKEGVPDFYLAQILVSFFFRIAKRPRGPEAQRPRAPEPHRRRDNKANCSNFASQFTEVWCLGAGSGSQYRIRRQGVQE